MRSMTTTWERLHGSIEHKIAVGLDPCRSCGAVAPDGGRRRRHREDCRILPGGTDQAETDGSVVGPQSRP